MKITKQQLRQLIKEELFGTGWAIEPERPFGLSTRQPPTPRQPKRTRAPAPEAKPKKAGPDVPSKKAPVKEDIESPKVQSFDEALEALNHGLEEVQLAGPLQTYNKLSRKGVLSLEHIKRLKSELPEVLVALARLEELAMAQHAVSSALNQALKDISRHRKLN